MNGYLPRDLPSGVDYVGRMRSNAKIHDPRVSERPKPKRGPNAAQTRKRVRDGPAPSVRLLLADQPVGDNVSQDSPWGWQKVQATTSGTTQELLAIILLAAWPEVLGLRPVRVVLVRDPEDEFRDTYLLTTNVEASITWAIEAYAGRWSIEATHKASNHVMEI